MPDKELIGWMEVGEALKYIQSHHKTACITYDGDEPPSYEFSRSIEFNVEV